MKKVLALLFALVHASAYSQFNPGQTLKAADLNAALATPTITGGTINNSPIGQITAASGKFTTLTTTGSASIGVAPGSWNATYRTIDLGRAGTALVSNSANSALYSVSNAYFSPAGDVYADAGLAAYTRIGGGATPFALFVAPSGTAGAPVSWTQAATIDSNGNLLLNMTSARVFGGTTPRLQVEGSSASNASLSVSRNSADANPPNIFFTKSRGTSNGAVTAVSAGDALGNIAFLATDGTNALTAAQMRAEIDGSVSTGITPTRFIWQTTSATGTISERMRLDSSGNLSLSIVGAGLRVKEGSNAKQLLSGNMSAGSITITNTSVTASSRIICTRQPGGTNPGAAMVTAISAGVSFTVTSTNAADTGPVACQIFEPA